jgi:hypothetical protein
MKRRACPWCVNLPLGGRPRTLDVRHRMSTVCHFIPAAELIKLKE